MVWSPASPLGGRPTRGAPFLSPREGGAALSCERGTTFPRESGTVFVSPQLPRTERTLTTYAVLPRECQTGTCDHEPGRCIRYRSRRCLSGECTHASQNLICGATYAEPPAPAPKLAPIDLTKPFQYRVDRADGVKEWSFSHGSQDGTTEHVTAVGLAQFVASQTRVGHSFYGALRVYVWQRDGDGVHYRDPVPERAERFDFPAQPTLDPRNQPRQLGAVD